MSRYRPIGEAQADESPAQRRQRWVHAAECEARRWGIWPDACNYCQQRIGHLPECMMLTGLSAGLPHEEVRPGCFVVSRHWIGDAIRAACEKRGGPGA